MVPVALAVATGPKWISPRLLSIACLASVIADADVIAFSFGIPYASAFGHRGFTHSMVFGLVLAILCARCAESIQRPAPQVFLIVAIAACSHPLLDAFTNGGLGVALAWPLDDVRWFAPWRPVEVSPIGLQAFLSSRGVAVLQSELCWVWLPLFGLAFVIRAARYRVTSR